MLLLGKEYSNTQYLLQTTICVLLHTTYLKKEKHYGKRKTNHFIFLSSALNLFRELTRQILINEWTKKKKKTRKVNMAKIIIVE